MQANRLVVIAPVLPAKPQPEALPQPEDETEAEKADDEVDEKSLIVEKPPEPLEPAEISFHLGRLLLTGSRMGEPYQVIAVIGIDPRPEQAPDPDAED